MGILALDFDQNDLASSVIAIKMSSCQNPYIRAIILYYYTPSEFFPICSFVRKRADMDPYRHAHCIMVSVLIWAHNRHASGVSISY